MISYPVAQMMMSTSCCWPSLSTNPAELISFMGEVNTWTFSWFSDSRNPFPGYFETGLALSAQPPRALTVGLLQPTPKFFGIIASRSSGLVEPSFWIISFLANWKMSLSARPTPDKAPSYLSGTFRLLRPVQNELESHIQFGLDHLRILQEQLGIVRKRFLLFWSIYTFDRQSASHECRLSRKRTHSGSLLHLVPRTSVQTQLLSMSATLPTSIAASLEMRCWKQSGSHCSQYQSLRHACRSNLSRCRRWRYAQASLGTSVGL